VKTILISDEAMNAIRSAASFAFKQTSAKQADGQWRVYLTDEVFEHLWKHNLPDESWSDTIIRAIATTKGLFQ